jgi:hypothetical protein
VLKNGGFDCTRRSMFVPPMASQCYSHRTSVDLLRLALVGPEIEVCLGDVELSVGEITRSIVGIVSAKMVDVGMGHQHGIDIL